MKLLSKVNIKILLVLICFGCIKNDNTTNEDPELTVADVDGNVYNTIKVGNQIWLTENLKSTTLNDGTPLTEFAGINWANGNTQIPFYQWADTYDLGNQFDEELPFDYYGIMYNHFAIETGKLAPEGWRIPTAQDFMELENYLADNGHSGVEGNALKTTTGWFDGAGNGTDAIGFKGLPNGYINTSGGSVLAGGFCTWVTSDVVIDQAGTRRVAINLFDQPTIIYAENALGIGGGIRCIKE